MARLILVSNRLPVTVRLDHGKLSVERSAGGLATGLRSAHERSDALWIGWPGDLPRLTDAQRARVDELLMEMQCSPIYLTSGEVSRYYEGFSNAVLWPLFHYLLDRIPPHSQEWDAYRDIN